MSALRVHLPGRPLELVDLGPNRAVPLPGSGQRGHAIHAQSGMARTDRDRANGYAARYREKQRATT